MSSHAIESAPSFSQDEIAAAEAVEQQAFEANQQQYLRKRVITLSAENTRLRTELDTLRAQAAGFAETPSDDPS